MLALAPVKLSDARLVQRALADDPIAFETLVHRYQRKASAIALATGVDPGTAADVVQEAFLEAFLHLPALRNRDAFGAWFLAIVRNRSRRSSRRSVERSLDEDVPSPSCGESLEIREFNAHLWRRVRELPQGVREAVLLYYHEGKRVREVARTLGTTVPAIKNRLQKGRELLRERLWKEIGPCLRDMLPSTRAGRREARRVSLAVLAALPAGWSRSASAASAGVVDAPSGSSLLPSLIQGVAIMTGKQVGVVTGFCIGLFLIGFAVGYVDVSPNGGGDLPVVSRAPQEAERRRRELPLAEVATNGAARESTPSTIESPGRELPATPPATTGALRIHAVWKGSEEPASGLAVRVTPRSASLPHFADWTGTTGDDGVLVLEEIPAGDVRVELARMTPPRESGASRVQVFAGKERQLLLRLPEWVTVRGTVVDREDRPVGGAEIWLSERDFDSLGARLVGHAAADGTFTLRGVRSGRYVSARSADHAPSSQRVVSGDRGEEFEVLLVLPSAGGAVEGQVLGPDGHPVAGALVFVGRRPASPGTHVTSAAPLRLVTGDDGGFSARGVAPGEVPVVARAAGLAPAGVTAVVDSARTTRIDLRLQPGAVFTGRVLDENRKPIPEATVSVGETSLFTRRSDLLVSETSTSGEGTFYLDGLPAGDQPVTVSSRHQGKERLVVALRAGEIVERDLMLRRLHIRGRVVLADGTPVRKCLVSTTGGPVAVFTDREGRFLVSDCEDRGYTMNFVERGQSLPSVRLEDVRPSPEELQVVIAEDQRPTASLTGKVVGPDGRSVRGARVRAHREGSYDVARAKSGFFGGVRVGPLPAGRYAVFVEADDYPGVWSEPVEVASRETKSLGNLQLPSPGFVKVVFSAESGRTADGLNLSISDEKGRWEWTVRLGTEPHYRRMTAPGRHRLVLRAEDASAVERDIEVAAGEETVVHLPLPDGGNR